MSNEKPTPTAALLGKFYKELRDQGLDADQAHELTVIAARELFSQENLVVVG